MAPLADYILTAGNNSRFGWVAFGEYIHLMRAIYLDVLAVAVQPIPESVIRNLPGVWNNSTPALVDDLSARGLLTEIRGNSTLTLPHYLLRETLLYRQSNLRRRSIHRQLAEAMESQVSLDKDIRLRQIALHAVAGEDVNRARRYGMQLLPDLPQEYTGAETVDFVQHLFDLLTPTASADEMVLITRALGTLHQSIGHLEIAGHWHRQTLAWAKKTSDVAAQAQAFFEMSELALMSIDYRTALKAAQSGLELISTAINYAPPLTIGRGHRLLGASLAMGGAISQPRSTYKRQSQYIVKLKIKATFVQPYSNLAMLPLNAESCNAPSIFMMNPGPCGGGGTYPLLSCVGS